MQTANTKLPDGLVNTGKRPSGSFYHFISKFLYERVPTTKPSRTACAIASRTTISARRVAMVKVAGGLTWESTTTTTMATATTSLRVVSEDTDPSLRCYD